MGANAVTPLASTSELEVCENITRTGKDLSMLLRHKTRSLDAFAAELINALQSAHISNVHEGHVFAQVRA